MLHFYSRSKKVATTMVLRIGILNSIFFGFIFATPSFEVVIKGSKFNTTFSRNTIFGIVNREVHWGFGGVYRLKKKSKIVLEIQTYSHNKWGWFGGFENYDEIEFWGLEQIFNIAQKPVFMM